MNRSPKFGFLFLAIFGSFILAARADDAADRATDIAQMKRVWQALMDYKKAKGSLPDKLSELIPQFLPDPKLLISPKDKANRQNGQLAKENEHSSSYAYEWGPGKFNALTLKEVKTCQLEEYGPLVPLLRCDLHGKVLNISHDGEFYESAAYWETSSAVRVWILKRGLGPGCSTGRFVEITTIDESGRPLEGVRVTAAARSVQNLPLPDRTLSTNAEGKVRMPFGSDTTSHGIISFSAERHFAMPLVSPEAGFDEKLLVTMRFARAASGVIRDSHGKAVAGARVSIAKVAEGDAFAARVAQQGIQLPVEVLAALAPRRSGASEIAIVESSVAGEWKSKFLPMTNEQKVEVTVSHPDFRVSKLRVGDPSFTPELLFDGKGDVTLREPIRLRGVLRDANGQPIPGATVFFGGLPDALLRRPELQMPEVQTDKDGAFEFLARVPGETRIVALPKGQPPVLHKFDLNEDTPPLQLSPPPGRKLTGRIVDTSGNPVPDVPIYFNGWLMLPVPEQPRIATTDADGRWAWENAPPDLVRGLAALPSGELLHWLERNNVPVEIRIPLTERQ